MLAAGQPLPEATVFTPDRTATSIRDVAGGSAALFLFYLFDWSGT